MEMKYYYKGRHKPSCKRQSGKGKEDMKYYHISKSSEVKREISYDEALEYLLANYKDNDMTREMLTRTGEIECMFSYILVAEEYDGKHYVGEIINHRGHECRVTTVWKVDGENGISIIPTGNYGFEVDITEKRYNEMNG